ncbi:MAG: pyridoxal phosphate-dependent aminotransferase [Candidatus Lokiarchaeota archaeon]|nr:pyridoxal phosphate-dependent aminotransferase [Candidatus Lokiarchaeota archaeon]
MKELSKKIRNAPKSKIRELFDLAAGRSDIISLGIGQPDFSTPQPAIEGTINALKKKVTYYAPTKGIPELLQQLENKLKTVNNIETIWKDNIILTNGGSQALSLAFASIFNPGDEIVISSPNFISYFYLSAFFDLKIIEIERKSDFRPDIEKIKESITEKTKAVLINSPNNPTGYSLDTNELQEIVDIVKTHDLYLISDEVYENYLYDDSKHLSPASLKDMFERTITLNAMSKLYSATGFRLGYVAANKDIIDTMEKYHQYTAAGTNHAAQYGFLEALKMDSSFFNKILKSFDERRLLVYYRLNEMGFEVVKPKGAFYIMPDVSNFSLTGTEFSERIMKEQGVAIVPGNIFGSYSESKIRISYATEIKKLEEAMDRIAKFVGKL